MTKICLLAMVIGILNCATAFAQGGTGQISGRASDSSGAVLP